MNLKCSRFLGKNVKVSPPKSYHSADATKNNVKLEDFKEPLDFNKITHAEAERMKSKRSGRDLPFIKIKCDDTKQDEALISGELVCQKTGIIFKVEEFRTTPLIQQCYKCQGFRHKAPSCTKKTEMCVVKLILTKTVQIEKKATQNVPIVEDPMSPTTEAILSTRIKPSGNM